MKRPDHLSLWSELSKPDQGWPPGAYRIEVARDGTIVATAKFVVDAPASP